MNRFRQMRKLMKMDKAFSYFHQLRNNMQTAAAKMIQKKWRNHKTYQIVRHLATISKNRKALAAIKI